jgi:hypothetical protein
MTAVTQTMAGNEDVLFQAVLMIRMMKMPQLHQRMTFIGCDNRKD